MPATNERAPTIEENDGEENLQDLDEASEYRKNSAHRLETRISESFKQGGFTSEVVKSWNNGGAG